MFGLRIVSVEWFREKLHPEIAAEAVVEAWNQAALMEAVLSALLEEPEAMAKALRILRRG